MLTVNELGEAHEKLWEREEFLFNSIRNMTERIEDAWKFDGRVCVGANCGEHGWDDNIHVEKDHASAYS